MEATRNRKKARVARAGHVEKTELSQSFFVGNGDEA